MRDTARILYVLRYLQDKTDEQHPLSIKQILDHLGEQHNITANRRTIANDIQTLVECGYDVVTIRSTQNLYFIGERHFELPELKLLIDAAQASKFLTTKRSKALIDKLLTLTSPHQAANLKSGLSFEQRIKPQNEQAYITADLLITAINQKKRVRFMYYEYKPDKIKVYKHGRRVYEFSPWVMVWNNDHYYILGHSESHGKITTFRVDRIAAAKLTDIDAVPEPKSFNLASYMKSVFQMYDGPLLDVTLKCENAWMKTIIDRFGEKVHTEIAGEKHFYAKVSVSASKTFYGWVFASGGAVEISSPTEAVEEYHAMLDVAKKAKPRSTRQS